MPRTTETASPWRDDTYGNHAPLHLSTRQLTANQHRELLPRVEGYVVLDGKQKEDYVQKVSNMTSGSVQ